MPDSKLCPSYCGYVGSTKDALLIIQSTIDGKCRLAKHRPKINERSSLIRSGNIFVFIEQLSGIKRWTDGIAWSPSRILGRFLVYRELDKNPYVAGKKKRKMIKSPELLHSETSSMSGNSRSRYVFTEKGLIKKTLSLTITNEDLPNPLASIQTIHLISYYNAEDVLNGRLKRPSENGLKNLSISAALWKAVNSTSLGGKIPVEDPNDFPDATFQFQSSMSKQQHPLMVPQQNPLPDPYRTQLHQTPGQNYQFQYDPHADTYSRNKAIPQSSHHPQPQQYMLASPSQNQIAQFSIDNNTFIPMKCQEVLPNSQYDSHNYNKSSSYPLYNNYLVQPHQYVYEHTYTNSTVTSKNSYVPPYIHLQQPVYPQTPHVSSGALLDNNNPMYFTTNGLMNDSSIVSLSSDNAMFPESGTGFSTSRLNTTNTATQNTLNGEMGQSKKNPIGGWFPGTDAQNNHSDQLPYGSNLNQP